MKSENAHQNGGNTKLEQKKKVNLLSKLIASMLSMSSIYMYKHKPGAAKADKQDIFKECKRQE